MPELEVIRLVSFHATKTDSSRALKAALAAGRASLSSGLRSLMTMSHDLPCLAQFRKHSRISRLTAFRCVDAGNTRLVTDIPSRACPAELILLWTANHELICALCCSIRENPSRRDSL